MLPVKGKKRPAYPTVKRFTHTRENSKGTPLCFHFAINREEDELKLIDVTVKGLSVMENLDPDLREGVYNEVYHKRIIHGL